MKGQDMKGLSREQIAWRVAQDLPDGAYVNLGIGLPTLVPPFLPAGREVVFQSENGLLGVGPPPAPGHEDPQIIDAGKRLVTLVPGASIFSHSDSFLMIRGGHLDVALLGAYQVSAEGDLANWLAEGENKAPAVGGAMDLAAGAKEVWAMMEHTTKNGAPRILERCSYELTAPRCIKRIFTNLAVIDVADGLVVREIADGLDLAALQRLTGAPLRPAPDCRTLRAAA
jgi:3-oxoadipate CoA-transferase beta subunit